MHFRGWNKRHWAGLSATLAVAALAAFAATFALNGQAAARSPYPRPAVISRTWQLTFKWHRPQRFLLIPPAHASRGRQVYWAMRYAVINHTNRSRFFYPRIEMVTGTGQIIRAGKGVSDNIFHKIKHEYHDSFLQSDRMIIGRLLRGRENGKEGVAIFTGLDKGARSFRIFITGLSGDTAVQKDPLTGKSVVLRKTLELKYHIPGQAIGIKPHLRFDGQKWVMR